MAKSPEQHIADTMGALTFQITMLRAQVEQLQEQLEANKSVPEKEPK